MLKAHLADGLRVWHAAGLDEKKFRLKQVKRKNVGKDRKKILLIKYNTDGRLLTTNGIPARSSDPQSGLEFGQTSEGPNHGSKRLGRSRHAECCCEYCARTRPRLGLTARASGSTFLGARAGNSLLVIGAFHLQLPQSKRLGTRSNRYRE